MQRTATMPCPPAPVLDVAALEADFAAFCAEEALVVSPYSADLFAAAIAEAGTGAHYGAPRGGVHCYRTIFHHLRGAGVDLW